MHHPTIDDNNNLTKEIYFSALCTTFRACAYVTSYIAARFLPEALCEQRILIGTWMSRRPRSTIMPGINIPMSNDSLQGIRIH
jgi:hypothetical protein